MAAEPGIERLEVVQRANQQAALTIMMRDCATWAIASRQPGLRPLREAVSPREGACTD
jgi:hypothetical protein